MIQDRERRLRHRAHEIWLWRGRPEDRAQDCRRQAEQELARLEVAGSGARDPGEPELGAPAAEAIPSPPRRDARGI